jgi:hypothetical protein
VHHSYGRADLGPLLERVREEYEHAESVQSHGDRAALDDPPAPVDNAFTVAEDQVRAKIATLTALRQTLSFDAIADATKANELAGVESDLAAAESELERTHLARAEFNRRRREAELSARQEARARALQRADELAGRREQADRKLSDAGRKFGLALASVEAIAAQQADALSATGHPNAWQAVTPTAGQLQRVLATSLAEAGASAQWIG